MKPLILLLGTCLILFSACKPEPPVTPVQTPPATSLGISGALNRLATQTQVAALTSTAESQRVAPILEEISAGTPSPLPSLPAVLEQAGSFQQVSRLETPIIGKVINMQTGQDGSLYLLSESGYSQFKDIKWTAYFIGETGYMIGVDPEGQGWAVTYDGSYISRWESRNDDMEIWIAYSEKEGWLPPDSTSSEPVNPGLFPDVNGNLWLSTAQDVRSFDGTRWESYTSQTLGMPPVANGSNASYTIYPMPADDTVYIGRCDWGVAGITGGGGLRKRDGNTWTIPDPTLESGCITAITLDSNGNLWIAKDESLYRYNSSTGVLELVPLPEPPPQKRIGYTLALTPDPNGSLWAQLALCDSVACFGESALYNLKESVWQMVGEPSPSGGMKLLFDSSGAAWVLSAGAIGEIVDDKLQSLPGLTVLAGATDSHGKLWLIAQSTGPPTLWTQP